MRTKFIVIVVLQILILVGLSAYRQVWIASGSKILLNVEPLYAYDLKAGRRLWLQYDISKFRSDKISWQQAFTYNDTIYVVLQNNESGAYSAMELLPVQPSGKLFIKGRVTTAYPLTVWELTIQDDNGQQHLLRTAEHFYMDKLQNGDRIIAYCNVRGEMFQYVKADTPKAAEDEKRQNHMGYSAKLKGTITQITSKKIDLLMVNYGIENYTVEDGGFIGNSSSEKKKTVVEVALRKDGKGMISAIIIEGVKIR